MDNHRFILEPYKGLKTRHTCPGCGKKGVFSCYIDQATGEPLAATVGRCNREINCGYHYKPGQYFEDNKHLLPEQIRVNWTPPPPEPPKPPSYIDFETFKTSRAGYDKNNFVKWLLSIFDKNKVNDLIGRYHIGTSNYWLGAVVFWEIDQAGRIRTGKIMGYNATTGRRISKPKPLITFVHSVMKYANFNLKQCYFGEHLLKLEPYKPVALVESEKTAVVASAYLPGFVWLAVGSLTNLNIEKCKPLAGRRVCLFPDLNGFGRWKTKAGELSKAMPGTRFDVSDLLERNATETERENGLDLCDYLTKFNWKTFAGEKGEKREALKTNYFSLTDLIRGHFANLNPKLWIVEPERLPGITKYNLEVLSEDIFYKFKLHVTPCEYFQAIKN